MSTPTTPTAPDHDQHLMAIALTAELAGRAPQQPLSPARFWAVHAELGGDLRAASSCDDVTLRQLARRTAGAALHASELQGQGISLITPFHAHYPQRYLERLGELAPPLLYVAGDPAVLADPDRPRLAVVGSPVATEAELDAVRTAVRAAVARGWEVVSGDAEGIEAAALNAAVEAGGTVIALLTQGVRRALRRGALRRLVSAGQATLTAPVHPDADGRSRTTLPRDHLIHALAGVSYPVTVAGSGGTDQQHLFE